MHFGDHSERQRKMQLASDVIILFAPYAHLLPSRRDRRFGDKGDLQECGNGRSTGCAKAMRGFPMLAIKHGA